MRNYLIKTSLLLVTVAFARLGFAQANNPISIIPEPQHMVQKQGNFVLSANVKIIVQPNDPELKRLAETLAADIEKRTGFVLPVLTSAAQKDHAIRIAKISGFDSLGKEGYALKVDPKSIKLAAPQNAGIFYGIQTINKLLPATPVNRTPVNIPAVAITDYPRFAWRGLMIDAGRYFYPVDFIKKYIDYMAQNKLNTFHWHLVEDGGWRIEIKKYPKLTSIGSKRTNTQIRRNPPEFDNKPHEGFYTQEQIKDVVAYAKARYVTIVPEIEMPGHTMSSLAAYPELSCTGGPFTVPYEWKIRPDIYCAGNEQTFKFLEDVLTEVAALFPGQYIHIGGDEAPKDRWKVCPKCQARIKAEGLKDEHELQSYFIRRIENFLLTKNKRIIGWDEILEGGLAPNAAVMSWRGIKGGIAAAQQHHDVIMTPNVNMYFDYYQGDPSLEPFAIGKYLNLGQVYNYEPVPKELSADEAKYIKGVQANVWCEYIHSAEKMEYMTWPRASAMAEVAWTKPEHKDLENFKRKMEQEYKRYAADGVNFAKSAYDPYQEVVVDGNKNATVSLVDNAYNSKIYYTTDGSEPSTSSQLYAQPFTIDKNIIIKSAVFVDGKKAGKTLEKPVVINK